MVVVQREYIQVRRSIKLELIFAIHGFGAVRVVKAHNKIFRDAAALFRTKREILAPV